MMKKRVVAAAFLALLALGLASGSWAETASAPVAGTVMVTEGKPQVLRQGEKSYARIKKGDYVYDGDSLKTGAKDQVALLFVGGAETRINNNSEFRIDSAADASKPTSLFSKLGQAWTNLVHGAAPVQPIEIHTPIAVCAVRGTQADVNVGDNMTVKVYEGHVDLSNDQGSQRMVAGQISQVSFGGAPSAVRKMAAGEYGTWQNGVAPKNVQQWRQSLMKASGQNRTLELKQKNGKDIKLHFQEKQ